MAWKFNPGFRIKFGTPARDLRYLLVRISPLSILACVLGLSSLFLPWLVESTAYGMIWPPEFTPRRELGLLDAFQHWPPSDSSEAMMTVILIVGGSLFVLFTFLGAAFMAAGVLFFIYPFWDCLSCLDHVCSGVDVWYTYSPAMGFYLCLIGCALGLLSAIPRIAPAITLVNTIGE